MTATNGGLAEFLRARRSLVTPEQAGLIRGPDRRVTGLRRDEVSLLAGISTDYYIRLEQGREVHPSEQVLEALASALDLDHIAAAHLYQLGLPRPGHAQPATEVSEGVRRLLDSLSAVPAFVLDPALDVLVANDLALALYSGFERFDNLLRMIFLDPAAATFYRDPDAAARGAVSHLRVASAPFPHDQHVTSRVREMQQRSAKFARLWERYEVAEKVSVDKVLQHREAGMLSLHYESLAISSARGLHLATYSATNEDTVAGLEALSRLPADGST